MKPHTKSLLVLKRHKFSLLFLVFITVVTYLSLGKIPKVESRLSFDQIDKLIHFSIYVIFTILFFLALNESKRKIEISIALRNTLLFAVGYGLLIELLQHVMPFNRMFEILDIIANSLGAIMGCWLIKKYRSLILPLK